MQVDDSNKPNKTEEDQHIQDLNSTNATSESVAILDYNLFSLAFSVLEKYASKFRGQTLLANMELAQF